MKINGFVFISVAVMMVFYTTINHAGPSWTHEEQVTWGAIEDTTQTEVPKMYPYAECSIGNHQSPVDLATAEINQTKNLNRLRIWYDVDDKPVFFNSGHGVQVNTSLDYTGQLEIGDEVFPLIQFHFHAPSEHVVGEKKFAAELHYVHVREDGRLVVLAVGIDEGEKNGTFQTILDNMPREPEGRNENTGISINPESLLPHNHHRPEFLSLSGSLTTPPCSEGVQWYFLTEIVTASAEQLEQLRGFYNNNVRSVQDLNGRVVSSTK